MTNIDFKIHRAQPIVAGLSDSIFLRIPLVEGEREPDVTAFLDADTARRVGEELIAQADRIDRIKAAEAAA